MSSSRSAGASFPKSHRNKVVTLIGDLYYGNKFGLVSVFFFINVILNLQTHRFGHNLGTKNSFTFFPCGLRKGTSFLSLLLKVKF